jgi:hypothetical protein
MTKSSIRKFFVEQIQENFLITLLILANIAGSFLIWAGYLVFTECILLLLTMLPNVSSDNLKTNIFAQIIDKILQGVTVILMVLLLARTIVSAFRFLMQEIKDHKTGGETDEH